MFNDFQWMVQINLILVLKLLTWFQCSKLLKFVSVGFCIKWRTAAHTPWCHWTIELYKTEDLSDVIEPVSSKEWTVAKIGQGCRNQFAHRNSWSAGKKRFDMKCNYAKKYQKRNSMPPISEWIREYANVKSERLKAWRHEKLKDKRMKECMNENEWMNERMSEKYGLREMKWMRDITWMKVKHEWRKPWI